MRVFLTGATGFIGSRVLRELLGAGHQVLGLTRSEVGERWLKEAGATAHRGALEDADSLARGAAQADAVIHTAFDHDFSRFAENCEKDGRVIGAMADALLGSDRPLVITSSTGIGKTRPGEPAVEQAVDWRHPLPRIAGERAGAEAANRGVSVAVVRLPQVHDTERQGLISPFIAVSRARGVSAYVGDGANRWPAVHVDDAARLYRLALERHEAGARYHAVAEEGVSLRHIAELVGAGLGLPVVSLAPGEAADHFGWLAPFVAMDMLASSAWTRARLNWTPTGPDLVSDLKAMNY
ncbi:nucleoside-diphosphate-sugar epimerase [Roseiarcus fermentans]|uniref:Nucleoside-diphosphate-sugar epimerase n=1 Tax=Roseiarcus fermentans TaxID=1473586 RepID=A0A366FGQ0_9HYPH|nr:SDR family oxidoreductase [Roseiarcus fermentans]RBP12905.1 nucleoside-diphosphate-sugar epimerase [Roseiarcus fermentans]